MFGMCVLFAQEIATSAAQRRRCVGRYVVLYASVIMLDICKHSRIQHSKTRTTSAAAAAAAI